MSAAFGSACLLAVRTRSFADVGDAVKHEHARNSVVSGGFLLVQKSTSYNLDKGRHGPTWRRGSKGGGSGPAEDLRPVSEVEAGVSFRPAVYGGRLQVTSQEATRSWYQAAQGWCGHTFPPLRGSWYPIRVTWARIGHQAINGLDEGVWNRTFGDLGAEG